MKESVIFCFSGTGNSLECANDTAKNIENCKVLPMKKESIDMLKGEYEYIGFVFPVYFVGVPKKVYEFISSLTKENLQNAYIFTLATNGGMPGNALNITARILKEKNINMNYGRNIKMTSNYVVLYNMTKHPEKDEAEYNKKIKYIIEDIKQKKNITFKKENPVFSLWYNNFIKRVNERDKNFNVSDECIGCEICVKVCPAKNIEMENNKPVYKHKCEQCVACIQFCPKQAINYKNKTQKRRRYRNNNFSYKDIEKFNNTSY